MADKSWNIMQHLQSVSGTSEKQIPMLKYVQLKPAVALELPG